MDQEKLKATIQDIAKTLKETGKFSINTTDQECVKAKDVRGHMPHIMPKLPLMRSMV